MSITIRHREDDRTATAGYGENGLGWFVEVRDKNQILAEYDLLSVQETTTLDGLLSVLVRHGFFEQEDIDWAVRLYPKCKTYVDEIFGELKLDLEDLEHELWRPLELIHSLKMEAIKNKE